MMWLGVSVQNVVSTAQQAVSIEARGVTVHGSSTCSLTCRSMRWIDQARGVVAPCMSPRHAEGHVEHEVSPCMRPEPCGATHGRPPT
ncbi:hypothetical protein F2Q68_00008397 [Brassica cretica]|uniref:Uncharacterized protein n=1 Tax=Brassica cretica TaxID=69181 RepID=A0A8S9KPT0_BRACR|nr:hypothetical protein F2Q68_00008397 [Brassica cretica]